MTKGEFKKLFDEHFEQVRSYLFFRSGDTELATDMAQETFLKIWEKQHLIDETRVKGLLFKIANDLFASYYRKEKRSFEFFKHYEPDEKTSTPEEALVFSQMKENYNQALERMPEKQRTVFLMSRIDQLTYKEIAEMVGISVKAVEKRMKLALNFLRTSLKVNES